MKDLWRKTLTSITLVTMIGGQAGTARTDMGRGNRDDGDHPPADESSRIHTATPIQHVIVIIGENRTFDNVYGTYVPRHGQHVANLLSKGIVRADGSPGPNSAAAEQFRVGTIDPLAYFIDTNVLTNPGKVAYAPFLPTPEAGGAPPLPVTLAQLQKDPAPAAPPFDPNTLSPAQLHKLSAVLSGSDMQMLTSGAPGLSNCTADPTEPPSPCQEPDTRVSSFDGLPNTVFPIVGPTLPYDTYTGDMVHRFFHMWQQSDCDVANASNADPAGCRNDLYPFVGKIGRASCRDR